MINQAYNEQSDILLGTLDVTLGGGVLALIGSLIGDPSISLTIGAGGLSTTAFFLAGSQSMLQDFQDDIDQEETDGPAIWAIN